MNAEFDLTDLRLFLNIVELGSITAGAKASHLSLAAGSARVLGMEKALAATLLARGRRGALPTPAGLALVHHARAVLEQSERLRQDVQQSARSAKHHIAITGTSAALREYLPDTLGEFLCGHPEVNVSVVEAASEVAVESVLADQADIAMVTQHKPQSGLAYALFGVNRFALVVPCAHPLVQQAAGGAISEALADGCDIVGLPVGSALQDTWQERAGQRGVALNYRVRVPGFEAQLRLIERRVGVSIMPMATALRGARTMAVAVLPLSDPVLVRQLWICSRPVHALADHVKKLVLHLAQASAAPGDPT